MAKKKSSQLKSLKDFKLDADKIKDIQSSIQGGTLAVSTRCVEKLESNSAKAGVGLVDAYAYD